MAKNRVFSQGTNVSLPVPEGVVSGQFVLVGAIFGVALESRASDGTCEIATRGVYELKVKAVNAAGNSKIEFGEKIYVKGGILTKNSTEGVFAGYALEEIASGAEAVILVRLGT
jgi:predicted RecA/RadA family phage recombinase